MLVIEKLQMSDKLSKYDKCIRLKKVKQEALLVYVNLPLLNIYLLSNPDIHIYPHYIYKRLLKCISAL